MSARPPRPFDRTAPPKAPVAMPASSDIQVKKQDAFGSQWNANSYHYEERDYSSWGKKRLGELLDKVDTAKESLTVKHGAQEFSLDLKTYLKKTDGDAWVNIRKGKKMTCFNYELELAYKGAAPFPSLARSPSHRRLESPFPDTPLSLYCALARSLAPPFLSLRRGEGHVVGGTDNKWDLEGKLYYELAVDDDPETRFEHKQRYPFQSQIEKALVTFVNDKFKTFVAELSSKGNTQAKQGFAAKTETRVQVGQYQKVSPTHHAFFLAIL